MSHSLTPFQSAVKSHFAGVKSFLAQQRLSVILGGGLTLGHKHERLLPAGLLCSSSLARVTRLGDGGGEGAETLSVLGD